MRSWWLTAVAAAILLVPLVSAGDLHAPLPPIALTATNTETGVVLSWLPPAYNGGHPITSYAVERLDGIAWTRVASVDAGTTTWTDSISPQGTYHVIAFNEVGPSLPSDPAYASSQMCSVVVLSGTPPQPVLNWYCVGNIGPIGGIAVGAIWGH